MGDRPDVPARVLRRLDAIVLPLPEVVRESAWVGVRWRVRGATIAHVFGGEDQLLRIVFRAEPGEVLAFENLGDPYFRTEWGSNVVGMILDDRTDWEELREVLTDSYCVQAPAELAGAVDRPPAAD
ncbi:MmcQ/YjbR family DNA-binding protein [Millisia brevis]|uniref:MmcQ/YjbR family DNA-binding protein n=1 Tax=Millisia brevis TaxID=264148 RepID=UPI0008324368|nr:MmcQ/YjbR family DNA-binding protein [Millisia brevis]